MTRSFPSGRLPVREPSTIYAHRTFRALPPDLLDKATSSAEIRQPLDIYPELQGLLLRHVRDRADMLPAVGTADQTMPALFAGGGGGGGVEQAFVPLAQLGAGPDGTAVLARRGERLVKLHQLAFAAGSPCWATLETRVRA